MKATQTFSTYITESYKPTKSCFKLISMSWEQFYKRQKIENVVIFVEHLNTCIGICLKHVGRFCFDCRPGRFQRVFVNILEQIFEIGQSLNITKYIMLNCTFKEIWKKSKRILPVQGMSDIDSSCF